VPELLKTEDLVKHFDTTAGFFGAKTVVRAVDGVSFSMQAGEVFAVVGESGCGKSTLARVILRLTRATGGKAWFDGVDLFALGHEELKAIRRRIQVVFQDPFASLNPRMRILDAVGEPFVIHKEASGLDLRKRVMGLLEQVGLPASAAERYPHEFSGGQRQRICIARAMALEPDLIVADEPLSALDVSIQAQIINLLNDLRKERNLSYLLISHDLHVVHHFADRVAVMYLGIIVEEGTAEDLFNTPLHPYTEALLSAVPEPDPEKRRHRILLPGDVPSPAQVPSGCRFHPRCPKRFDPCDRIVPELAEKDGRKIACHLVHPV